MSYDTRHRTNLPSVVLAGGRSLRMGQPKADALLCGKPLISQVLARLVPQVGAVAINHNGPIATPLPPDIDRFEDTIPGFLGPLAGIASALLYTRQSHPEATHVLTVPIDTPFFPTDLAARLNMGLDSADQIAVAWSGGNLHPIFGLWPVSISSVLEDFVRHDEKRRVRAFLAQHDTKYVQFPVIDGDDPFFNINSPEDLRSAEQRLQA